MSGRAVPEGNTVYVMIQELTRYGEPWTTAIWKPSTGEGFDARDVRYWWPRKGTSGTLCWADGCVLLRSFYAVL